MKDVDYRSSELVGPPRRFHRAWKVGHGFLGKTACSLYEAESES